MNERQEQTMKALRRAWREFCETVNKMGVCELSASVEERERDGEAPVLEVFGRVRVGE